MLMTLFKILMSESATGLQKQLYALASFCEERQLTVNLSKTKVVVFEHRQSDVPDFKAQICAARTKKSQRIPEEFSYF